MTSTQTSSTDGCETDPLNCCWDSRYDKGIGTLLQFVWARDRDRIH